MSGFLPVQFGNHLHGFCGLCAISRAALPLHLYHISKPEIKLPLFQEALLIDKSLEAFALSLELYNKPILTYKAESFLVLVVNAWELLLKSLIVRIHGEKAIFYEGSTDRTLSVSDCVAKLIPDANDVVRKNLELIIALRDQATHLVIPEIQSTLSRLFQANVMNFVRVAEKYEIRNPLLSKSMGLLSLVADIRDADREAIRLSYDSEIYSRVEKFLSRFNREESEANSPFYAIPIEYRFVLSSKAVEGDIEISLTKDGTTARVVEIPKDPDRTHPFRAKELLASVNESLKKDGLPPLNRNDILSIVAAEKVRADKVNKYHYRADNPVTHKYSQDFADLILKKIREHKDYLTSCRSNYVKRKRKTDHA